MRENSGPGTGSEPSATPRYFGECLAHPLSEGAPPSIAPMRGLMQAQTSEEATAGIVAMLADWDLLDPRSVVLDIGCGIGRLEAALASRVASVTGLDLSRAMLEEASRRCRALPNVRFVLGSASDLSDIPDASVDLILLIDTFPHVMRSGRELAAQLCAESARVLEPAGSLLILNVSYGGDADADLLELAQLAEGAGLEIRRADWRPLTCGDAPAFQLVRTG